MVRVHVCCYNIRFIEVVVVVFLMEDRDIVFDNEMKDIESNFVDIRSYYAFDDGFVSFFGESFDRFFFREFVLQRGRNEE